MAKASKRQKLTPEEKKEANRQLRKEIFSTYDYSKEDRERIVNTLRGQNLAAYALVLFLPPVGIWYIWTRREKLYLNKQSVVLWTFVGIVIFIGYIQLILAALAG